VGAGVLFWMMFPLWLAVFWGVQGYPPVGSDFARWYALGAFNAAPIVATVGISPLILMLVWVCFKPSPPVSPSPARRARGNSAPRSPAVGEGQGVRANILVPLLSAFLYALLVPPVAYALLLMYAEMWQYRAWDAMTPTLTRAYGLVGGAAFVVGCIVGWSLCPSRRRAPAGAVTRGN
jgi:hypothetical protein